MAKTDDKITHTNWVTINGIPVKVSELPVRLQQALGNRVRREPLKALGFIVEPVEQVTGHDLTA